MRFGVFAIVFGFVIGGILSVLGSSRFEPSRSNPLGRGNWLGARTLRWPLFLLGAAGIAIVLFAAV